MLESIILLNVGGVVNLLDFLSLTDKMCCYVLDSHRPINLYNLFSSSQVVVIDDGSLSGYDDLRRAFEEIQFGDYSDDEEDSGSEQDGDEEEREQSSQQPLKLAKNDSDVDDDDGSQSAQKPRASDDNDHKSQESNARDEDFDESTEVEDLEEINNKRKSLTEETIKKKLKMNTSRLNKALVNDYYSKGSYFSTPITNSVYSLSSQLGKDSINFLWFNIISVSNNYIYGKLDLVEYTRMAADCKEEVDRLSATQQTYQPTTTNTREKNPDDFSINFIEDLQLMQLRHWNLYDSMYHSSYVATKLGIWKQKGRQNLVDLLVKMGLSRKQSEESHVEMNNEMKMSLSSKMSEYCPRYNMRDIVFPSFERKYGFLSAMSCSDVVYAMTALLDCGTSFLDEKGVAEYEKILQSKPSDNSNQHQNIDNDAGICCLSAGAELLTIPSKIATDLFTNLKQFETDERENWTRHFYLAFDAFENPQITKHGIILSIYFQKLLINQAISVLEKKMVQTLGNFQLCIIKNTGEDEKVFGQSVPLLYRLMEFLMNAFHVYGFN